MRGRASPSGLRSAAAAWLLALGSATGAADWPQGRADAANTAAVQVEAPRSGPPRRWTLDGGQVVGYEPGMTAWSSPALGSVGGRAVVVVGSYDRSVRALDATSGELLWKYTTGAGVFSTPALREGGGGARVFAASSDRTVYALDATDGHRIWSHVVEEYRPTLGGARLGAPCLTRVGGEEAVVVSHWAFDRSLAGSMQRGGVSALAAADGRLLWRRALGDAEMTSPVCAGDLLLLGSSNGNVYALRAEGGATRWQHTELDAVRSPPAVLQRGGERRVLVASKYGALRALDGASGAVLWSYKTGDRITGSPALARVGGRTLALVGSYDRSLHAVDAETGALAWRATTRGGIYGSPAIAGELVLFAAWDHQLHAVTADGGAPAWSLWTGRPLWEAVALDDSTWSSPSAARIDGRWMAWFGSYDGRLYGLPLAELGRSAGPVRFNLAFWLSLPASLLLAGLLALSLTRRARRRAAAAGPGATGR